MIESSLCLQQALHMRAKRTFTDDFKITRKNGEEWLIKMVDTETHIPAVYEEVVGVVNITTLTNRQYCVILDPVDEHGRPQLGKKKLVKGEKSFFLMPGERLEKGIQNVFVLGENEGLILRAIEMFTDEVRMVFTYLRFHFKLEHQDLLYWNIFIVRRFCHCSHFDGLLQKRRNSMANALELRLSCAKPSIWYHRFWSPFVQRMACCLMIQSRYLNQHWLIVI